jgi:hypothetical protein
VITYCATLDVPRELAQHVSYLLHAERRRRGTHTSTRALTCFWQAVPGLRWFRQNADMPREARSPHCADHQPLAGRLPDEFGGHDLPLSAQPLQ